MRLGATAAGDPWKSLFRNVLRGHRGTLPSRFFRHGARDVTLVVPPREKSLRFLPIAPRPTLSAVAAVAVAGCSLGPGGPEERGRAALERGDPQEAYRVLAPAAEADPAAGELRLLLGAAGLRTLRLSQAALAVTRAVELLPGDPRGFALKAAVAERRSLALLARESAAESVRLAPEDAALRVGQGLVLLSQGRQGSPDHAGAEAAFREALRLAPGDPVARFGLAKALVGGERHEEATPILDELIDEGVEFGEVLSLRGLARTRGRDFEGAAADLRRALQLGARDPGVHFALARTLIRMDRREEAEEQRRLHEAAKEREGLVDGLLLRYSVASGDVAAATDLGRVLTDVGRTADAITVLQSAAADYPDLPRPRLFLARAAFLAELYDLAAAESEAALALAPDLAEASHLAANVALAREDGTAALKHAQESVRLGPGPELPAAEQALTLAAAFLAAGRPEDALAAIARGPGASGPRAEEVRGRALLAAGRAAEAERALSDALRSRGFRYRWFWSRGRARLALGSAGPAADDFRSAAELAPWWPPAWEQLGEALRAKGDGDRAAEAERKHREAVALEERVRALRPAVIRDPADRARAMELAALLQESGRLDEAGRVRARAFENWGPSMKRAKP